MTESQVLVKIRVQHSLISHCVVILTLSSSSLFSRNHMLASKRLGSDGQLAQPFCLPGGQRADVGVNQKL